jgi:hypothetical protein
MLKIITTSSANTCVFENKEDHENRFVHEFKEGKYMEPTMQ